MRIGMTFALYVMHCNVRYGSHAGGCIHLVVKLQSCHMCHTPHGSLEAFDWSCVAALLSGIGLQPHTPSTCAGNVTIDYDYYDEHAMLCMQSCIEPICTADMVHAVLHQSSWVH